jgi:hypothetical protein
MNDVSVGKVGSENHNGFDDSIDPINPTSSDLSFTTLKNYVPDRNGLALDVHKSSPRLLSQG